MREKRKILKRKNRFYRWIASMLIAALLIGQGDVSVLAQEETVSVETVSGNTDEDVVVNGDAGQDDVDEGDEDTENGEEEFLKEVDGEETVSGNGDEPELSEATAIAVEDGVETHALSDMFTVGGITYEITNNGKRTVKCRNVSDGNQLGSDFVVPKEVTYDNVNWNVTEIGEQSFYLTSNLKSVKIPDTITKIGKYAFAHCDNLEKVEIWGSTNIGNAAFAHCAKLHTIDLTDNITQIEDVAFSHGGSLRVLNIYVDKSVAIPVENKGGFDLYCSHDRYIVFKKMDGTELTGVELEEIKNKYKSAPDGNTGDELWYGWQINKPVLHTVTIDVRKDDEVWSAPDHGRTFALSADKGNTLVTDLSAVAAGTYNIYDITDGNKIDTGVSLPVDGNGDNAIVDYYTVSFYDSDNVYPDSTLQAPQIVLAGQKAVKPADPTKTGYKFTGWVVPKEGSDFYDFDSEINKKTDIYASWETAETKAYIINASAGEGGSISPSGIVSVNEGESQQFTITPDDGYRIKIVTVDGTDRTEELADSVTRAQTGASKEYIFQNVNEDHTITASFEKESGSGDTPSGDDNTGDDNDRGGDKPDGGESDGDDSPDGDENGGESASESGSEARASNNAEIVSVGGTECVQNNTSTDNAKSSGNKEPKTGDASHAEVYATVAMIAGLTYLLLYFMEERRGMTEREKEVFVAAFIRWAKKGGTFRRCCAMAAIFCLLVYYHSIGKHAERNVLNDKYLGMAS